LNGNNWNYHHTVPYIKYLRERGLSYSQIGAILDISKQRVHSIVAAKSKAKRYIDISPSRQTLSDLFSNVNQASAKQKTVARSLLSRREVAPVLYVSPDTLTHWVIQIQSSCLLDGRGHYIYRWLGIDSLLGCRFTVVRLTFVYPSGFIQVCLPGS
jgi:hypothetical protein